MGLGWTEIILILAVLMFLFGPSKLPSIGKSMGEAFRGFKKGLEAGEEEVKSVETRIVHSNQQQLPPGEEQKVKDKADS